MKLCKRIRATLYCVFFIASVLFVIACFGFTNDQGQIWRIRKRWARLQLFVTGIKVDFQGAFDENATMILMNHQSMLDIMIFEEIHPKDICWIAKKEIAKLFFIGKMLKIPKMIAIDRKNPRSMALILSQAKEKIAQNRPICHKACQHFFSLCKLFAFVGFKQGFFSVFKAR